MPGRLIPGQICRTTERLSQSTDTRTLAQSTTSNSRITSKAQSFVNKSYIPCSNPIAAWASKSINFFSADDLIPYGADSVVLAPIAITLERLSERHIVTEVIYGLAD